MGVLKAHDRRPRPTIRPFPDEVAHLLGVETTTAVVLRLKQRDLAEAGLAPELVMDNVSFVADHGRIARPAMGEERDQVPHGAAHNEDRCLLAHPVSRDRLEPFYRRVFAEDVVADL